MSPSGGHACGDLVELRAASQKTCSLCHGITRMPPGGNCTLHAPRVFAKIVGTNTKNANLDVDEDGAI